MRWWFLHTPPLDGVANMALDEALLERARATGQGVVRVYAWSAPTLSLGRNQVARQAWDRDRAATLGLGIVRRLTGGRAVLHHREITYSVTAPAADRRGLRADYAAINELLLAALQRLGVDAAVARPAGRLPPPGSAPCFERPAAGELVAGGRKLVGSAQVRDNGAFLQHGSILVHDDQHRMREVSSTDLTITPAATLSELLGREVHPAELAAHLRECLRESWDSGLAELPADAMAGAAAACAARYTDDAWTWRR